MDINGKSILVTGGTGSFGQRCCEKLYNHYDLKNLVIYSRDESKQFYMMSRFRDKRVRFMIGDVRDRGRLLHAMGGIDIVIHAAALKQVPQAEYNPYEYVKTNITGSQNIIEAALEKGVECVITTSTDKSVHPLNHYGATKLCADKLFSAANFYAADRGVKFASVRMGNLIGSRGSVIPEFVRMSLGGSVQLTDPRMTRFWMTLDQAVDFVLARLADIQGGEVFVPMTPTMKLTDLVEAISPGCRIEIIGIRPGEKIDEILISPHEAGQTVRVDDYFVVLPDYAGLDEYIKSTGAAPVEENFEYSSTDCSRVLSVEKMREILKMEGLL
ncbi:MAG: UDP-N-acetylglucosamine 4,6-dehydratase (inverting) [Gemmatimonadota bacterium]|nr:UDP-N-acetylglucosamine 4,6-dehydratase (inverting) [Gemmatimonadota bacterium]